VVSHALCPRTRTPWRLAMAPRSDTHLDTHLKAQRSAPLFCALAPPGWHADAIPLSMLARTTFPLPLLQPHVHGTHAACGFCAPPPSSGATAPSRSVLCTRAWHACTHACMNACACSVTGRQGSAARGSVRKPTGQGQAYQGRRTRARKLLQRVQLVGVSLLGGRWPWWSRV
jgi:hypothetical protein